MMNGTVIVLGSINADTSYRMTALPAPGETVLASTTSASPGGKGANQAIAAAAAGAVTRMVGMVGDDSEAAAQVAALALRGVDTGSVATRRGAATGRAVVFVDDSGENSIVVLPGANDLLDGDVAATGLASISTGDVLVLQNEVPADANRAAARLARSLGAMVIWNAAPAPTAAADLVHDIDLLVVNEHELRQISGILGIEATAEGPGNSALGALLAECARALDTEAICTLGPDGAIFCADGLSGRVPAPKVRAVDTTAAGDTVVGYLAAHAGLPMEERLRLAAAAGALAVTVVGASSSIPQLDDVVPLPVAPTERTPA
ncbi:ribokinase [Arthrobacter bambusae]|uniref:PfkB family carbohydrate kinase n=1 Tax=Arthrobacter bambusae TaxID=1338426 RepID=UPI001F511715|nr:PfkB family carbohydrate kinase [Arthrobacter bambusae]MCI0143649.1 ribokinase [Arthrobacter bambusae]